MTAQSELDAMDAACRIQNMSAAVGINLFPTQDIIAAKLYGLIDVDADEVVYIGKAETPGGTRHLNENKWILDAKESLEVRTMVGIQNAARTHSLDRVMWRWSWDPEQARAEARVWSGKVGQQVIDEIDKGWSPTTRDVDKILIRIQVACGVRLYNSSGAGMWENYLGSLIDNIAHMAARYGHFSPGTGPAD